MGLARTKYHTLNTCFLSVHMCSRICKHDYRITFIVKIGYHDHSPARLVVTGVPLARDDIHSPRATVKHTPWWRVVDEILPKLKNHILLKNVIQHRNFEIY